MALVEDVTEVAKKVVLELEDVGIALEGVAFEGMILEGVAFEDVALEGVVFEGVALEGVVFEGVIFEGAVLEDVAFEGVVLESMVFEGVVLEGVAGRLVAVKAIALFPSLVRYERRKLPPCLAVVVPDPAVVVVTASFFRIALPGLLCMVTQELPVTTTLLVFLE